MKLGKSKLSVLNKIILAINLLAVIVLLISEAATYICPERFWILAIFGLGYPIAVAINFLFVSYWLITTRKILSLISLITILIGSNILLGFVQYNIKTKFPERMHDYKAIKDKEKVKIMSYNVRLFDLYNWWHNLETRGKMFNLITDESPDIACFQEFFHSDRGAFHNLDTLVEFMNAKNYHVEYTINLRKSDHWGMATFSKYPIVNKGKLEFGGKYSNNSCIYSDIKINDDTIRVYNIHLQSINFMKKDYSFMDSLIDKDQDAQIEGSKRILWLLKKAYIKRAKQTDMVAEHISHSPYPVIVCGDFNDPPSSYAYHILSHNLKDAFRETGRGFGQTFIGGSVPSFRIDYILHDKKFKAYQFTTIHKPYSDHYPITCLLDLHPE
jgi:endonuclease/exonuclease/phosphatase family metal-dependent hydrolase